MTGTGTNVTGLNMSGGVTSEEKGLIISGQSVTGYAGRVMMGINVTTLTAPNIPKGTRDGMLTLTAPNIPKGTRDGMLMLTAPNIPKGTRDGMLTLTAPNIPKVTRDGMLTLTA